MHDLTTFVIEAGDLPRLDTLEAVKVREGPVEGLGACAGIGIIERKADDVYFVSFRYADLVRER